MLNARATSSAIPTARTPPSRAVRASGLRVTGFQVLRDFEGLSGHLHAYKVDVAKAMLQMCRALGSTVLLACSSTSAHATGDRDALVARPAQAGDAGGAARHPHRLRGALLGPARQRVPAGLGASCERADRANLGICLDSFHMLAHGTDSTRCDDDRSAQDLPRAARPTSCGRRRARREERIETARHYRVFPGEGVHSAEVAELVRRLDEMGYRGDYSFEVFNDDYKQLPLPMVAERARRSVKWITGLVSRRSLPARRPASRLNPAQ